jgi:hypothetical protein
MCPISMPAGHTFGTFLIIFLTVRSYIVYMHSVSLSALVLIMKYFFLPFFYWGQMTNEFSLWRIIQENSNLIFNKNNFLLDFIYFTTSKIFKNIINNIGKQFEEGQTINFRHNFSLSHICKQICYSNNFMVIYKKTKMLFIWNG